MSAIIRATRASAAAPAGSAALLLLLLLAVASSSRSSRSSRLCRHRPCIYKLQAQSSPPVLDLAQRAADRLLRLRALDDLCARLGVAVQAQGQEISKAEARVGHRWRESGGGGRVG